jgi:hypothetical protein
VVEPAEREFWETLTDIMDSCFIDIWKSTRTGKYMARMKGTDPTANGRVLRTRNIAADGLTAMYTPRSDVYNAIYVDFNYSHALGQYLDACYADNTTIESYAYDRQPDNTIEAQAEASQDLYGRRELRVRAPHIKDIASAWDTVVRRMDLLSVQRVKIVVSIADNWAYDIEPCEVFTTDSSLDDIMRYPGFVTAGTEDEPSWDGRKWWVTKIQVRPYQPTIIEAINVD